MKSFYAVPLLFFSFLFFTAFYKSDYNKPLPNWIDPLRERSDGLPPELFGARVAPPDNFRIPAEYEPVMAITMGWAGYTDMLTQIAQIASNDGNAEVWVAQGPSVINDVPTDKYFRSNCDIDTVWMRDYGPFGIFEGGILEGTEKIGIIDTIYRHYSYRRNDDKIPTCLAEENDITPFAMPLIYDGGNFMVDSAGNLFMTKRIYNWNSDKSEESVNSLIKEYFNIKNIHTFEYAGFPGYPKDGTGHIDMYLKLLSDDTILITETLDEPFKTACDKAVEYFKSIKTPDGKEYNIVRIPGWQKDGTWYTYTNSLIINNVVIVPVYSSNDFANKIAVDTYRKAMPGIKIKTIFSDYSITSGGSIHCVTQQIPKP